MSSAAGRARTQELEAFLASFGTEASVSGAAALVGDRRRVLAAAQWGVARPRPARAVTADTRFDLASVTKPFVATLALALDRRGILPLELELGEIWTRGDRTLLRRPLGSLLRHRAGFVPWTPLYRRCRRPERVSSLLLSGGLLGARAGTYSDLDYVLWGLSAERRLGSPLTRLLAEHVAEPLAAPGLGRGAAADSAATELNNDRERSLAAAQGIRVAARGGPRRGEVQDGNARFLGGLAGHAGLFAAAGDVYRLGREWLRPSAVLEEGSVAEALAGSGRFRLGWERRRQRGGGGAALAAEAFGHAGFTGCSLWVDPVAGRVMALLAHRRSSTVDLDRWRREFHALAAGL